MCTSIISNGNKTIIGFNLDILDMEYQVVAEEDRVYIAIQDDKEGWLPLFGANSRGDFVAMPTCWPFDERSNPAGSDSLNIINLDIYCLGKKHLMKLKRLLSMKRYRVFWVSPFNHSYQIATVMFCK